MSKAPGQKVECPFFPTATLRSCLAGFAVYGSTDGAVCCNCEMGRARTIQAGSDFVATCVDQSGEAELMSADAVGSLVESWMATPVLDRWKVAQRLGLTATINALLPIYVCEQQIFERARKAGKLTALSLGLADLRLWTVLSV